MFTAIRGASSPVSELTAARGQFSAMRNVDIGPKATSAARDFCTVHWSLNPFRLPQIPAVIVAQAAIGGGNATA